MDGQGKVSLMLSAHQHQAVYCAQSEVVVRSHVNSGTGETNNERNASAHGHAYISPSELDICVTVFDLWL